MSYLATLGLIIAIIWVQKSWWALIFVFALAGYIYWKNDEQRNKLLITGAITGVSLLAISLLITHIPGTPTGGIVIDRSENYLILATWRGKFYLAQPEHHYEVGDVLTFSAQRTPLKFYTLEQAFDFGQYLRDRGIVAELTTTSIRTIVAVPIRVSRWQKNFLANFPPATGEFLAALIFNQRNYQAPLINQLDQLQIVYLLGVSGLHLSAIVRLNRAILKLKIKNTKLVDGLAHLPLVIIWVIMPSHFPLYRIGLSYLLSVVINKYAPGKISSFYQTIITALILLIFNPLLALQASYYLSFGLIITFQLTSTMMAPVKKYRRPFISGLVAYSLVAPLMISSSYQINLLTFILTPLLAPVFTLSFIMGWISFLIVPMPLLFEGLHRLIQTLVNVAETLNLSLVIGRINLVGVTIYYLLLFALFYAFEVHHRPLQKISLTGILTLVSIPLINLQATFTSAVYFINVGQGDAILLRHQNYTLLVDTGGSLYQPLAATLLKPFLMSLRITRLDAVWITHADFDHNGALEELVKIVPVKRVLDHESSLQLGSWRIENLNSQPNHEVSDRNEASAVLYTQLMGENWLLMGDAGVETEIKIAAAYPNLAVDILKLGHHGSSSSTSAEFLSFTSPKLAIISVGRNRYRHPSAIVLERLVSAGIPYLRTDQVGTIRLTGLANLCYNETSKKFI